MNAEEIIKIIPQYMIGIGTLILASAAILQALRKAKTDVETEKTNDTNSQNFRLRVFRILWKPIAALVINVVFLFTLNGEGVTKSFIFFCVLNGALFTVILHALLAYCWLFWFEDRLNKKQIEQDGVSNG